MKPIGRPKHCDTCGLKTDVCICPSPLVEPKCERCGHPDNDHTALQGNPCGLNYCDCPDYRPPATTEPTESEARKRWLENLGQEPAESEGTGDRVQIKVLNCEECGIPQEVLLGAIHVWCSRCTHPAAPAIDSVEERVAQSPDWKDADAHYNKRRREAVGWFSSEIMRKPLRTSELIEQFWVMAWNAVLERLEAKYKFRLESERPRIEQVAVERFCESVEKEIVDGHYDVHEKGVILQIMQTVKERYGKQ